MVASEVLLEPGAPSAAAPVVTAAHKKTPHKKRKRPKVDSGSVSARGALNQPLDSRVLLSLLKALDEGAARSAAMQRSGRPLLLPACFQTSSDGPGGGKRALGVEASGRDWKRAFGALSPGALASIRLWHARVKWLRPPRNAFANTNN